MMCYESLLIKALVLLDQGSALLASFNYFLRDIVTLGIRDPT